MGRQMVLGKPLGLLLRPLVCQAGHLAAIPSNLPTTELPQDLLLVDRHRLCLLLLDNLQRDLLLHPSQLLLESKR
jgi:hypothetical protein